MNMLNYFSYCFDNSANDIWKDHMRWIVINCILEIGKDKTTFIYTWPQGNIDMRQDLMRLGVISAIGLPAHQMDEARGRIVER